MVYKHSPRTLICIGSFCRQGVIVFTGFHLTREIAAKLDVSGLVTTASLGVFIADGDAKLDDALHEADTALYRAKALGRDRTEYAEPTDEPAVVSRA